MFKTVEQLVNHTQMTMPSDKVLVQMADGDSLTVGEYFNNVNKISNMLVDLGMEKGCKVGVLLPNCIEYSYLYITLARLGVIVVPINQFLQGDSLIHIIDQSDAEFLVTSKELFFERIKPVEENLNKLGLILFIGENVKNSENIHFKTFYFDTFNSYPSSFKQPWEVNGEDVQGLWYTSGSTGLPKGVMITQEAVLSRTSFFKQYFKIDSSDVIFFTLTMYHQPYFNMGITLAMASGCTVVNVSWFSARKFWEHIVKYKGTVVLSTGTIIPILLKQEIDTFETRGKELVRLWIGWPIDEPDVVTARWPKVKFLEAYGLSEYALASINTYENPEIGSAGPPTPYTNLKICDPETGEEVAQGNIGEIVMRHKLGSGYMMAGYYKLPDETKKALRSGWFYSGDLGYMDEKGCLHFVDRCKDSIRVGGENVPSAEVEAIIRKHPKINEVSIVGVKGELGHSEIFAHVVVKEKQEFSPEEFFEFCTKELAYYMIPRYLYLRKEIPKTASLKAQKYKLREEGIPLGSFDRKAFLKKG